MPRRFNWYWVLLVSLVPIATIPALSSFLLRFSFSAFPFALPSFSRWRIIILTRHEIKQHQHITYTHITTQHITYHRTHHHSRTVYRFTRQYCYFRLQHNCLWFAYQSHHHRSRYLLPLALAQSSSGFCCVDSTMSLWERTKPCLCVFECVIRSCGNWHKSC